MNDDDHDDDDADDDEEEEEDGDGWMNEEQYMIAIPGTIQFPC